MAKRWLLALVCAFNALALYTACYILMSSFQTWRYENRVWNIRTFDSRLQWMLFAPAGMIEMGIWRLCGEDFVFIYRTGGAPMPSPAPGGAGPPATLTIAAGRPPAGRLASQPTRTRPAMLTRTRSSGVRMPR